MIYILDNNSIRVLGSYYPEQFPRVWERLDECMVSGALRSVHQVYAELEHDNTSLIVRDWIRKHKRMFLKPSAAEGEFVAKIFSVPHFQQLIGEKQRMRGLPVADPFLVAAAHVGRGCVVTEEAFKPNAAKIPNVCHHFDVECCDLRGMMQRMQWVF